MLENWLNAKVDLRSSGLRRNPEVGTSRNMREKQLKVNFTQDNSASSVYFQNGEQGYKNTSPKTIGCRSEKNVTFLFIRRFY